VTATLDLLMLSV